MIGVHPRNFYAGCVLPESKLDTEDKRLFGHIKQSWLERGTAYGYRRVFVDLGDLGVRCGIMHSVGAEDEEGQAEDVCSRRVENAH